MQVKSPQYTVYTDRLLEERSEKLSAMPESLLLHLVKSTYLNMKTTAYQFDKRLPSSSELLEMAKSTLIYYSPSLGKGDEAVVSYLFSTLVELESATFTSLCVCLSKTVVNL